MEEINNVEGQEVEREIILDKAKLEEKIASLTARKEELSSKIAIARMSNKRTNLYNTLLTLYSSVCGLIVSYEAALFTLAVAGYCAFNDGLINSIRVLNDMDELAAVNQTLTMYKK